ncbi:MAG: DNA polymerase III subunit beta [Deltaproteobacteria bacterium RIFCSPLOWO2_02_FULL_50_16]|nr:MAG: DNA polymerase III subunit beta [Deltaproteobacteria bacterium RIFCSPLOWO2_02_FULL_50_16]
MEFKVNRNEFLKSLRWIQGVVERKTTMPILTNVLIEGEAKRLTLTATDLEIGIRVECPAEVSSPGMIVVSARSLYEIIKELVIDRVRLKGEEGKRLEIHAGRSEFKVVAMKADDFPSVMEGGTNSFTPLEGSLLLEMVEKTAYAISSDETRYALNGVYIEKLKEENGLRMVATDGHRLSYVDRKIGREFLLKKGVIIPKKGIQELKKLISEGEGDFELALDEKNMMARRGTTTVLARLIEGQYPEYQQVIPTTTGRYLSVHRETFIGALKRASVMATDRVNGIHLKVSPGNLEVSSNNPDLGEAREELDVDYKGETFQVGFNPRYLLDILNVIEDEKVVLELKDEVSPCIIRSEYDKSFLALVMPMRV